jgi:hypothetical protein
MLPQRMPAAAKTALASDIAAELKTKLEALKKQDMIAPSEEKELQAEIERIRKDSLEKIDASTWEASDSMREKFAAKISEKQDAMKWAADALSRFSKSVESGSANAGASGSANSDIKTGELGAAIDKLAHTGMLANAPEELQKLLGGKDAIAAGKCQLPKDAQSLKKLAASFKNYLGDQGKKFSDIAQRTGVSRFDPSEYPDFNYKRGPDCDGDPGTGGLSRGRADADLTWGKESLGYDLFKSQTLPQGSYRSPDEWVPFAIMPGAPKTSPELSGASSGMKYTGVAQSAWRRSLAPRHYSAVKKYFDNSTGGKY